MQTPPYRFTTFYTVGVVNPMVHETTCYAHSAGVAQDGASVPLPITVPSNVVGGKLEKYDARLEYYALVSEFGRTS